MIRNYETMVILNPELEEEARKNLLERFKNVITGHEGEIVEVDEWGNKSMAFEIKDKKSGYYTVIYFKGEPAIVDELERNYRIIDDVLRYLIIKKD